tara:strand:- start:516 stop:962 length:447 start_codon:yes stop_codon:yes gene_type:complete
MAIITYSTTDIDFSTFDTWSNDGFTDNTDITLSTVLSDAYPAAATPFGVGEISNRSWFYGNVHATANGSVQVTAPYSSATSTGTLVIKNVDYSVYTTITLTAAGTYPFNFSEWRTAAGGGGTQLSTNANLNLTVADQTSQVDFYAYFT